MGMITPALSPSPPAPEIVVTTAPPPPRDVWVEVVHDPAGLATHLPAWDDLARSTAEPNPFFESWLLLPAVQEFGTADDILFALVYHRAAQPNKPPSLIGLFPLQRCGRSWKLPVRHLRLWQHLHSFLLTPLLRAGREREALAALLEWAAGEQGAPLLELPFVDTEGPFAQALVDVLNDQHRLAFQAECHTRALLRRAADAESYCAAAMSTGNRKELRRQRKRLAETGKLESRILAPDGDVDRWLQQFLELEATGWKGQEKTALAASEANRAFFSRAVRDGFARGQVQMLGLFLDERPIALKCNFLSGHGAIAFKICFDETLAKFSPGVQLELDNIEAFHAHPQLRWMDSCAIPGHSMINRLWRERRTMQTLLIATGRWAGNLTVGLLPLARAVKRMMKQPS